MEKEKLKQPNQVIQEYLTEDSDSLRDVLTQTEDREHTLKYARDVRESHELFIENELKPATDLGSELMKRELPKWKDKLDKINEFITELEDTQEDTQNE